jgi:hypothetical protein
MTERQSGAGFLPLREAAKWAGVSERTLKRWIGRGLPQYQAGPREKILICPNDIHEFLKKQQTPTPNLKLLAERAVTDLIRKRQSAA